MVGRVTGFFKLKTVFTTVFSTKLDSQFLSVRTRVEVSAANSDCQIPAEFRPPDLDGEASWSRAIQETFNCLDKAPLRQLLVLDGEASWSRATQETSNRLVKTVESLLYGS